MGEDKRPTTLFVRKSSGLVREVSLSSALFYNLVSVCGTTAALLLIEVATAPLFEVQIGPWLVPGFIVGCAIALPFMLLLCFVYVCLVSVMPRTGGDYVFTTRITNPLLGWLEGWSLLWTVLGFIGTTVYYCNWSISSTLDIGAYVMGYSSWIPAAQWWLSNPAIVLASVMIGVIIILQALLPTKTYFEVFKWTVLVAFVLSFVSLPLWIGVTPATALAAFQHFSSMTSPPISANQVNSTAVSLGLTYVPFSLGSLGVVLGLTLFIFIGFQFSVYFAGELRGNVSRNVIVSTLVPTLVIGAIVTVYAAVVLSAVGFVGPYMNWAYVFWASPSAAPLYGSYPMVQLISAMVNPSMAILGFISGIGISALSIIILSTWAALVSRIVFAWSLDRVIPSWFAAVNRRTHTPLRVLVLAAISVVVLCTLAVLGANPAISIWFTVLMSILTWVMPGINAMLLPYRRKDLFELAPSWARKKLLGVWILAPAGALLLAFFVLLYFYAFVAPFVAAATSAGLAGFAGYAMSTGIVAFIVTIILGILIWYVSKWHNAKMGIRFQDIFTQLPPQ